jgi:hypothetical protein
METGGGSGWIVETERRRLRHSMAVQSDTEQMAHTGTGEQCDNPARRPDVKADPMRNTV